MAVLVETASVEAQRLQPPGLTPFAMVARSALGVGVTMVGYEVLKEHLLPGLSKWGSHSITIAVTTVLATVGATFVARAQQRVLRDVKERNRELTALKEGLEAANVRIAQAHQLVEEKVVERTAQLTALQARQQAVLEACNAVPWEFVLDDRGGQFTYIAPQVERISGYAAERFSEPGFLFSCVHPDDRAAMAKAFARAPVELPQTFEYRMKRKNGTYATVRAEFRREAEVSGRHFFRGLTIDLSKERELEFELRQAQKLESVGRLAAGVAHEINTPVQFVSDSVHFLQGAMQDLVPLLGRYRQLEAAVAEGSAGPEQAEALAVERDNADLAYVLEHAPRALERSLEGLSRVAEIVRSMKEFARPEQREMAPVDINSAIASTLIVARGEYKLVADVETLFGDVPQVFCFAGEINQVLLSLITNAAHAIGEVVQGTDKKGTLAIETAQDGEAVTIAIRDTGGGIPAEIRERIFEPFFTTKEVGKGTGQGLAISRAVVQDKHGGTLSFTTEIGIGTTFTVRLPIEGKQARAMSVHEPASPVQPGA